VTRRTSRHGTRYTEGSRAGWSPGDSRTCLYCGGKLRITVDAVQVHTDAVSGVHSSWHLPRGSCVREVA